MIGHVIKERRKALGLTQGQLSEASGVPQGRISEYERGAREPTVSTLQALAGTLGPFVIDADGVTTPPQAPAD